MFTIEALGAMKSVTMLSLLDLTSAGSLLGWALTELFHPGSAVLIWMGVGDFCSCGYRPSRA